MTPQLPPPATRQQLMTSTSLIYAIVNGYDGKLYIGKTKTTFLNRYGPRWWMTTTNVLLQRTLKHANPEDFTIHILEEGLPKAKLNERERYWAQALNSYCPYGYNIRECGEEGGYHCPETRAKIEKANKQARKTYQVCRIATGKLITIEHVKEWCKTQGLREMAFRNLLCGIVQSSQGYCLPDTIDQKRTRGGKIRKQGKQYTVVHIETGKTITFQNAALFAEEHKLSLSAFKTMLRGRSRSSQGYRLPGTFVPPPRLYEIRGPDGTLYQFNNLRQFEREHGIRLRGIAHNGIKRNRKGWSEYRLVQEGTAVHALRSTLGSTPTD